MKYRHSTKRIIIIVLCLVVTNCGNSRKQRELEAFVQQVEKTPAKKIDPLPELKTYPAFIYKATELRSPFVPPLDQEYNRKTAQQSNGIHPNMDRQKEVLENFPLDSLRMVGTLEKNHIRWALIIDPRGTVYRITQGNYLGHNHGRIDNISEDKISIDEIIPDPAGGWRERKNSIVLVNDALNSKNQSKK